MIPEGFEYGHPVEDTDGVMCIRRKGKPTMLCGRLVFDVPTVQPPWPRVHGRCRDAMFGRNIDNDRVPSQGGKSGNLKPERFSPAAAGQAASRPARLGTTR